VVAVGGVEVQREVEDRKEVVVQSVAVEAQMAVVDVEHIHILEALVHWILRAFLNALTGNHSIPDKGNKGSMISSLMQYWIYLYVGWCR